MVKKFKDPVDALAEEKARLVSDDEIETTDEDGISGAISFESVPFEVASKPHPFDGYPDTKVKVGDKTINLTHLVQFDPSIPIYQDPSGKGQAITNKQGQIIKVVNIKTVHNRVIQSYEMGKKAIDVVFDRDIVLPDGKKFTRCAWVPDASVRAQLVFKLHIKTAKIEIDSRYKLADMKQSKRLRELFTMIVNPTIKAERLAREITGEEVAV